MIGVISAGPVASLSAAQSTPDRDQLTAKQAAADLCEGKVASKALVAASLARAKANADLNAFITLDEAGAMKGAAAFDAHHVKGRLCKPLGGLPIVIKDNMMWQAFLPLLARRR